MAVLCLLTNTPWPWPTPARVASARGGFLSRSATEGERSEGLHKRSAEDKGAPCARQERSSLGRFGDLAGARRRAEEIAFGALRGVPAEEVTEEWAGVRCRRALQAGGNFPLFRAGALKFTEEVWRRFVCGRYVRRSDKQKIAEWFHAESKPAELPMPGADYNGHRRRINPSSARAETQANERWC